MLLFLSTAAALALAPTTAQEATSDELVARIEAYLAPFEADGHLSGTILVARGDDVLFERAFGMANHELGVPNTKDTLHGIASISKSMTLVIGIQLLEEQKLEAADTIDTWLPDFPRGDRITVEDLMRHRAGIPHRVTTEIEETVPRDAADMVELTKQALADESAFLCEPGAASNYSSAGYSVLARVLELAAGQDYDALLQQYVCEPAGMEHTLHADARTVVAGRSACYLPYGSGVRNAQLKDLSFLVGAGSVVSTAGDLLRFATAVRDGTYGDSVRQSLAGAGDFSSNGATNGFRAFVDARSDTGITVAVTANMTTGALDLLRAALPRLLAGEEVEARERLKVEPIEVDAETLTRYEGEWQMRPGSSFEARVEAGDLMVGSYVLVPTGEDRFFSFQDYAEVTFAPDEDGNLAVMTWGGATMRRL